MKKQHLFILGGLALVGYLWYRHSQKEDSKSLDASTSNASGGTNCKCKNGFVGYCASGNCAQCCGKMGYNSKSKM